MMPIDDPPPPCASHNARVLARQHRLDLRILQRSVYVITTEEVLAHLDTQPPTRRAFAKHAPLFVPRADKVRRYQWECVRDMYNRSGFIISPCGSGKTLIGLLIAVLNGGRFLILTTRYAEQWKAALDDFFKPIDNPVIAVGDEVPSGRIPDVCISTYSAFGASSNRLQLAKHVAYQTVVLDEAHGAASPQSLNIIDRLSAVQWCALTATKVREDQELQKLEMRIGGTITEINRERLVREGFVADVSVTNLIIPYDNQHNLEELLGRHNALALHPNKIQTLLQLLRIVCVENHKTIVFCDDLFCLDWSSAIVTASKLPIVGRISMSTPREERRVIIDGFQNSTNAAILFVSRTGDEALDVPSASAGIVFWNHWASRRQIVQRIGRLSRVSIGPSPVFYVLLADDPREIQASKHREEYLLTHGFAVVR